MSPGNDSWRIAGPTRAGTTHLCQKRLYYNIAKICQHTNEFFPGEDRAIDHWRAWLYSRQRRGRTSQVCIGGRWGGPNNSPAARTLQVPLTDHADAAASSERVTASKKNYYRLTMALNDRTLSTGHATTATNTSCGLWQPSFMVNGTMY